MHTDVNDSTEFTSKPTDALEGKLCDIAHDTLAGVPRASSALLAELEHTGCVEGAVSASGT